MVKILKSTLDAIQQKAKERTVKTQTIEYDLETLLKKVRGGAIKLDPEYQRRHRWSLETSSRLIESLILNIPIPVIFISQDVDVDDEVDDDVPRYTVIDGQQRMTAIVEFMSNGYELAGLEALSELNGSFYKDLPSFLIRRLEERTVKCLRIDSTVDSQVKYDIFERLNTGSIKLEAQELRNVIARGHFNKLIKELAENEHFRSLLQIDSKDPMSSTKVQKMEDVELVLRFFALKDGRYKSLKKGFKQFLTDSLVEFNYFSDEQLLKCRKEFVTYMSFLHEHGGQFAFAKVRFDGANLKKMSSFNAAVFDAVAVGLSQVYSVDYIKARADEVAGKLKGYQSLFKEDEFFQAVSGSVNDAQKVRFRVDAMVDYLSR